MTPYLKAICQKRVHESINILRIIEHSIIEVSFLQTPIPLLIIVQASLICGKLLSFLSTNISRNFLVDQINSIYTGKWALEDLANTVKNNFDTFSDNTGLQKNFPIIKFLYSVSFFPAEYKNKSHFFPSRLDFPKNYDKGLKINKIGCF